MEKKSVPVVVEQVLSATKSEVWNAITDADQMRKWFFPQMIEFEPSVGFVSKFDVELDGRVFPHVWTVTEVEPESRLSYEWRYEGIQGNSFLTWTLEEVADGTKLTIEHSGQESFPQDDPIFSREAGESGWKYLIQQCLVLFLAGELSS